MSTRKATEAAGGKGENRYLQSPGEPCAACATCADQGSVDAISRIRTLPDICAERLKPPAESRMCAIGQSEGLSRTWCPNLSKLLWVTFGPGPAAFVCAETPRLPVLADPLIVCC
jgi:hypothetical protein